MADVTVDRNVEEELIARVPVGSIFEHYKGKHYKIITIARAEANLELCVVYQALYTSSDFGDHAIWIRPLTMFLETVVIADQEIPRFRLIAEGSD
jgi:hypothetical protein